MAGYPGTKAMEPVSMTLYQRESGQHRAREDETRPGPPFQVASEKTARLLEAEHHRHVGENRVTYLVPFCVPSIGLLVSSRGR